MLKLKLSMEVTQEMLEGLSTKDLVLLKSLVDTVCESRKTALNVTRQIDLTDQERTLVSQPGGIIPAIRALRARTGLSLKDAKSLVDTYIAAAGIVNRY